MNTALARDGVLSAAKAISAIPPASTQICFARPTGTDRNGSEANRSQCKTLFDEIPSPLSASPVSL